MIGRELKPSEKQVGFEVRVIYRTPIDPPVNDTAAIEAIKEAFARIRPQAYVTIETVEVVVIEE